MKATLGLVSVVPVLLVAGCNGGGGSTKFFTVSTNVTINGINKLDPGVRVIGDVPFNIDSVRDCQINPGGIRHFDGTTNSNATFRVDNPVLGFTCAWALTRGTSPLCPIGNGTTVFVTSSGPNFALPCGTNVNTFTAAPPSTITIAGANMYPTYAVPRVYLYDQNENVWLQVNATSASADGRSLVFPSSGLSFPGGEYGAVVYVMQSNGTWNAVGGASVEVWDSSGGGGGGGDDGGGGTCHGAMDC
jgi:hypothetical protein